MKIVNGNNHPKGIPLSGLCHNCGKEWNLINDHEVAVRSFYVDRPVVVGDRLSEICHDTQKRFMSGKGFVVGYSVFNPVDPDLSYDQNLADYDVWEPNETVSYLNVDQNYCFQDRDGLTVQIALVCHKDCYQDYPLYQSNPSEDSDRTHKIVARPSKEYAGTAEYQIISEKHETPYFNPPGHFDLVETITFCSSQSILCELMQSIIDTKIVIIRGDATVHHFCDYLQIGAMWDPDEAVASGREDHTGKFWVDCTLEFKDGQLVDVKTKISK